MADTKGTLPASGGDPDSRKRAAKVTAAAAESRGDTDGLKAAWRALDALKAEEAQGRNKEEAAARRERAAAADGGASRTSEPSARTSAPRSRTDGSGKGA